MGVFVRADSKWFYLWLEPGPQNDPPGKRVRTTIRSDALEPQQQKDNRAAALDLYHVLMSERARRIVTPDAKPSRTFKEQAAWFEQHALPRRKGREREAPLIPKLVAVFGAMPLAKVTRTLVTERWITPRLTTPTVIAAGKRTAPRSIKAGPRTVNREVAVIKAIVQSGVPDYLETSPLFGMPLLKTGTPKRRILTRDEEARLLPVMAADDRALFLIGLDALVRLTDILDARWENLHKDRLWIADPKSGGGFAALLSKRAQAALKHVGKTDSPYIFTRRRRAVTERDRRNGIRQMLKHYCALAKVPYGRKAGGITFHWATRRTGATRMLTAGVDLGTVQKIGDWETADVVLSIYHELTDDAHRHAVETVGPPKTGNGAGIGNAKRQSRTDTRQHRTVSRASRNR